MSEIFITELSTVINFHFQPIIWRLLLLDLSILLKKKQLGREGGITGLPEVTATGGRLMERDNRR